MDAKQYKSTNSILQSMQQAYFLLKRAAFSINTSQRKYLL